MGATWDLDGFSERDEIIFVICYGVFAVIALTLGRTAMLKPVRLMTTFFHEFSHATMCWLTGGSVKKIEVYNNEGGVTGYTGGCRILVIPAGYVGAALAGASFVALAGNRTAATCVCAGMTAALLFTLAFNPNGVMICMSLCFSAVNIGVILFDYLLVDDNFPLVEFVALFYGVFIGWFAVRDIYDDLITRTAEGSDAVACHQVIPCCFPRCVGVQFWLVSFCAQALGLYMALVWLVSNNEADEDNDDGANEDIDGGEE